ncbi:hypothetical protein [Tsukamurella paurometabola]|uniref:Uncharacterized protein n=1 Tax=Tsukamurella paurometabola TaxID=2061 RepID=A0A3P8MD66_TSUPA|nr:hypothetical protein [Tsukamurella paurometabola]UEA82945.1 hypothetical protein LK411_21725 [Tsukamurella paurometabola]VDR40026.1 Uncharacterised protein [Tsukamurella paurometabola]
MTEHYVWGEAELTHPDWRGTLALDERITGEDSLYSLTGVDKGKWQIIGIDLGGGEREFKHDLHVIALDRDWIQGRRISEIAEFEAVDIFVHDVDPYEVLRAITHQLDIRMRLRGLVGKRIAITNRLDVPEQTDD